VLVAEGYGFEFTYRLLYRYRERFKAALRRAKLPGSVRFHDLRRLCAALLIAQGVHPRTVMETLGHPDIRVTMNLYGHVFEAAKHEAAAKMDALLAGGA
jgi:integrase